MATRSLRNRMSSRFSSPAVTVDHEVSEPPVEVDGSMKVEDDGSEWREPPVRTLPPSYKDHKGLERLGVLELQQPLGVPPSQKLLQRLKLNVTRPSNRGTPLPEDEVLSQDVDSEAAEVGSSMDMDAPVEETDTVAISSPPRGRPSNREAAEMRTAGPVDMTPSPVKSTFSGTPQTTDGYKPTSIQEHLRQERVMNYVARAVTEAQERGDWGLVPGLEKIRKNANDKRDLWIVLEAIAHKNPTSEQLHIFKKFIKRGIRRHRRDSARSSSAMSTAIVGADDLGPDGYVRSSLPGEGVSTFTSPFRVRPSSSYVHASARSPPASPSSRRPKLDMAEGLQPVGKVPRRRRSRTHSSSSSLSSAKSLPEDLAPGELREGDGGASEHEIQSGRRQAGERHSAAAGSRSSRRANNLSSINTTDHASPFHTSANKIISDKLKKSQQAREEADLELADLEKRRKRLLKESEVDYNYREHPLHHDRHQVPAYLDEQYPATTVQNEDYPRPPVVHAQPAKVYRFPRVLLGVPVGEKNLMNGTSRKRAYDEIDDLDDDDDHSSDALTPLSSSPAPPYFAPPPPPGAVRSRAATPRTSTRNQGPINKVARKSARVLVSPNKPKNGGITAGFTRAGAGRVAEPGSGADSSQEDNDEFCASCGGEGKLLCCDGCTNSFHHACLEPPLDPNQEVDGEWYCPQCLAKQIKDTQESKSMMAKALRSLEHTIPRAFALPEVIRYYFEGVRTGEEGEYTEFGQPRTQGAPKMNRAGFIEEPNYKEPRDSKGKLNLCKGCGLGTNGKDLIPCDYCEAKWHLDCVDPPLPIPPRRRAGDKPNASWRCPLHIDQDLVDLGRQAEAAPGDLGGRPRLRKPKNAKHVDVDFPRGFRNNGVIDVELSEDSPSIREIDMAGTIYRLPEQAIRLDFIDRVKRSWYEDRTFPDTVNGRRPRRFVNRDYRSDDPAVLHAPLQTTITIKEPEFYKGSHALAIVESAKANAALRRKTLPEQQAVLNLTNMARKEEGHVYGDSLADLTNALVSEIPERAEQLFNADERAQLQRLQSLVERRMRILDGRDGVVANALSGRRQREENRYFSPGNSVPPREGSSVVNNASKGFRELQPTSGSFAPMPYYSPGEPNAVLNGQPQNSFSQPPFAGPPPPQLWQSPYTYPAAPAYGQWQAPAPPASASPAKSHLANMNPYLDSQMELSGGMPPSSAAQSTPQTLGQSLLQNMPPFYSPVPPSRATSVQEAVSGVSASPISNPNEDIRRHSAGNDSSASVPSKPAVMVNGNDAALDPALFGDASGAGVGKSTVPEEKSIGVSNVEQTQTHGNANDHGLLGDEDVDMADDEGEGEGEDDVLVAATADERGADAGVVASKDLNGPSSAMEVPEFDNHKSAVGFLDSEDVGAAAAAASTANNESERERKSEASDGPQLGGETATVVQAGF